MSNNTPYVVKQVLKLYDMSHLEYVYKKPFHTSITVHLIFTPKEETVMSPKRFASYGVVNYYKNNRRIEELMKATGKDIPILSYVSDDESFYKFLEDSILKIADAKYNTITNK